MKHRNHDQSGSTQLIIIIVAVVVVLAALGFAAWRVLGNSEDGVESAAKQASIAACDKENDKNICRFYSSWKADTKYRMTSTDPSGTTTVFEIDGDKSHIKTTGEMAYEVITIGKTTYTKAGDVWYMQTVKDPEQDVSKDYKTDFKDPSTADDAEKIEDKTVYKSLGKETCGKLTCFKYEVSYASQADTKEFIWFDDKDYRLQKSRTETSEGASEMVYEYTDVEIKVPSPVKELGADQYIVPGENEPMTMPSAADYGM